MISRNAIYKKMESSNPQAVRPLVRNGQTLSLFESKNKANVNSTHSCKYIESINAVAIGESMNDSSKKPRAVVVLASLGSDRQRKEAPVAAAHWVDQGIIVSPEYDH